MRHGDEGLHFCALKGIEVFKEEEFPFYFKYQLQYLALLISDKTSYHGKATGKILKFS